MSTSGIFHPKISKKYKNLLKGIKTISTQSQEKPRQYRLKSKTITIEKPTDVIVPTSASDLVVITKTKDLVVYIFNITKNSPKKFRHTFISRLQNLALDCLTNLCFANETYISKEHTEEYAIRKQYQKKALSCLKMLEYMALLSCECQCILLKQYTQIIEQGAKCQILINNWIKSDKNRISK